MTAVRKPLDAQATAIMVLLCFCWGLQQVALKVAAPVISTVMQIGIRSAIASVMVVAYMIWRGVPVFARDGTLAAGTVAGLLFAFEFLLIALGLGYTSASHMSVFLYTAPIFTALGLHFRIAGERLSWLQWAGVFVAFLGVVAAFAAEGVEEASAERYPMMWLGDLLGVLAGAFWGLTTVVIRATNLSEAPPTKTLIYQLVLAAVVLIGYAWLTDIHQIGIMTPLVWSSMVFQTLVVAFGTLMVWFWLLRHYLASRVSVFTFLTPVLGIALGVTLLDEPLTPGFILGSALIVTGIALVNWPRRRPASARA